MLHKSSFTLTASELRNLTEENKSKAKQQLRNNIHIVSDRVVDAYNIGSIFRIADSVNAKKVWLCGKEVVTPENKQVQKSSMNTCELIDWEKVDSVEDLMEDQKSFSTPYFISLEKLKEKEKFLRRIVSIKEVNNLYGHLDINHIMKFFKSSDCVHSIFIIVGSEHYGISEKCLNKSDLIVEIPMLGINHSMNVINALTLVCYSVMGLI